MALYAGARRRLDSKTMDDKKLFSSRVLFTCLVLFSWAGMIVHNRVELPMLPLLRPEHIIPTGIYVILLVGWLLQPEYRRLWTWLLFIWVAIHFVVGAGLSVLPLSIWPFYPEQSIRHYFSHVIYGLTQIPLIWHLVSQLRALADSDAIR